MIQIRNESYFAGRNKTDSVFETVIISFQLLLRGAENCIIPMAKKLNDEPKKQYAQKQPFSKKRYCPKGYTSNAE